MTVSTSAARHLLVRFAQPAKLPDAILAALRDEVVLAGWMRASGVISDVQIRVLDPRTGSPSNPRRISGSMQVITMEGSVGLVDGDVSCGLRVVLARETESGLETIAGDLVDARIETLEVLITAFDDVTATRQLDRAGVWVLDATEGAAGRPSSTAASLPTARTSPAPAQTPPVVQAVMPSPMQSGFSQVVRESEAPKAAPSAAPPVARPSPTFSASAAMPARIARPVMAETEDDPIPEAGDTVEHFAFGRCEVVKTDGDRLHVRLGKEQRVKEIALEMLKVTSLPPEEGQTGRHWKLARKL